MLNVLIVDDKPAVLEGLREMIPWMEINATLIGEARNGRDALAIAMEKRPDIIITDIKMPIMDGLQLCESVSRAMPHTVKIILSAYEDFSYAQTGIRCGVHDYILKPIDYEKIEVLSQKMKQIAKKKMTRQSVHHLIYDPNLQVHLHDAIKNADIEYLQLFFSNESLDGDAELDDVHRNCYYVLLNILFDFAEKAGINLRLVDISKEEAKGQLLMLDSCRAMKEFVLNKYLLVSEMIKTRKNSRAASIIEVIKKYIQDNFTDPNLTVNSIADKLNITLNYVSQIFHQFTGEHTVNYITKLRIEKACLLLKETSSPIQQIALEVGYGDPQYFARAFKKVEGITPSQYRNFQLNIGG